MEAHREYRLAEVEALDPSTAHPSPEAWPADRPASAQDRMRRVHAAHRAGRPGRTVVVVPSRTVEKWDAPAAEHQAYEERLLCHVLDLRDPGLRLVYVTSAPVARAVAGYYLSLLPATIRRSALSRLTLLSARDASPRPLAAKVLEQPRLQTRIRWAVRDADLAYLAPYTTTEFERDLALALDLPMYGADPRHAAFGTKSGARTLFARAGIPHPLGAEHVTSAGDVVRAIARLRRERRGLAEVLVKLDDGVSGEGNALVDLRGLPAPGTHDDDEAARIGERVGAMALEADGVTVEAFVRRLARGGIVEERITGEDFASPSVQLELTPAGAVEVVSTHDQVLGGHSGQSYLGCRFPADPGYARQISELARTAGRHLVRAGVIGRCAIDFVAVRDRGGPWRAHAIELNLRKGGTTHPLATLASLTGGAYDARDGAFATPAGERRCYVATDHLEVPGLDALTPGVLTRLATHHADVGFDDATACGVVLHLLSALRIGRVGLTAIGTDPADAQRRYDRSEATIRQAASTAALRAAA